MERIRKWLARGNEQGVTTRRMNVAAFTVNQGLIVYLVVWAAETRAEKLIEPVAILLGAILGIYIAGRTFQANRPQNGGTQQ